jgi:hypothetical protein
MTTATVRLPQPLSVTGQVTFDPVTQSLLTKPAETGLGSLLWRQGYQAMMRDDGSFGGPPAVYARVAGRGDVGRGEAVRDQWLRFQLDDPVYRQLAREGVSAICTVDRQTGNILAVRFLG